MNFRKEQSQLRRWYKEINWGVHRKLAQEFFQKVIIQAEQAGFFERLFVSVNDHGRQIQLAAGSHPAGPLEQTYDSIGNRTGQRFPTEGGAALVISQGADGSVGIFLYPFKSEKMARKIPHITWAFFTDPKKITERVLQNVIRDYFTYMHVTSVHFSESFLERLRIGYLELRGLKYSKGGGLMPFIVRHWLKEFIVLCGAVAGVIALFK